MHQKVSNPNCNNNQLIKIVDILGKESKEKKNIPLFYIFDDGTIEKKSMEEKEIPFQVVFFKDVSKIKSTSIEVVSYVLNGNLVLLGSSNRE